MHLISGIGCRHIVFVVVATLVFPGCALTASSSGRSTVTAALSYEIPLHTDVKSIVDFLETTSARVLRGPVTVDEGMASFLSGDAIHPVTLLEKIRSLDGLGEVAIPSVSCPRSIAAIHKLIASEQGLRLIAGCVTVGSSGTRIDLLDVTTGHAVGPTHSTLSHDATDSPISHIGAAFVEQFPATYRIGTPDIPIRRRGPRDLDEELVAPNIPHMAVPLVCFAPNATGILMRVNPDGDPVGDALGLDMIVQAEDPSAYVFLHIAAGEGRAGWVKRADVRWLPCPIV